MQTVQRGPVRRKERAGCEPGMSVPIYRNEQISAGRCPRRRSRNSRGAAGRPALAVPSVHALTACSRFEGSGLRPSLAPRCPGPGQEPGPVPGRGRAVRAEPAGGGLSRQPMTGGAERYITAGGCHWLWPALAAPRGGHTLGAVSGSGARPWKGPGKRRPGQAAQQ